MKMMQCACVVGVCCLHGVCCASGGGARASPDVVLDLALYPKKNNLNLPTLGTDTAGSTRVSVGLVARTLVNGYNLFPDTNAPVFVRISPHAISIRLEWKFK